MEVLHSKLDAFKIYLKLNPEFQASLKSFFQDIQSVEMKFEKIEMLRGKGMGRTEKLIIVSGVNWDILRETAEGVGYPIYYNDEIDVYNLFPGSGVGFDERGNLYFPEEMFARLVLANKKPAL